jgi:hypothetical protein
MLPKERTSSEWFHAAARCYLEGHQACAWCGTAHQVFRNVDLGRVEYQCNHCEFHVSHDLKLNRFVMVPGEKRAPGTGKKTMHDVMILDARG